jgi:hypothetical protein
VTMLDDETDYRGVHSPITDAWADYIEGRINARLEKFASEIGTLTGERENAFRREIAIGSGPLLTRIIQLEAQASERQCQQLIYRTRYDARE